MFDVIVIGAGPAGMAAGIYTAAQKLITLVITKNQTKPKTEDFDIFNMDFLRQQFQKTLDTNSKYLILRTDTEIHSLEKNIVSFSTETAAGEVIYGKSVIIATGNSDLVFDLLTYKAASQKIKVDSRMQTNVPGVFAAGDCNDAGKKNLLVLAGEGAKAALSAGEYLKVSTKY
jgi:alkyl hydroperoxide reductase subunit F